MNKNIKKIMLFSIIIYIVMFALSLFIGRYTINIIDLKTNFELETNIIFNLRLPRAIISSLAGISLSLSGLIYQETFQNDLVSPDLLGVSSGAGVGASIAIVLGLSNYFIVMFSFVLGIATVLLTVLISNIFKSKNNINLILSGIIVGSFMSSILTTIKYFVNPETQLSTIVYWLMGSFANITYQNILFTLPIVLISFIILLLISHRINLVALGKEETETKGINYIFYRNIIIIIATFLTATIVSNCGTISWIGLIIPHIVKSIVGRDVNKTLPLCAIFGTIFTLITDILSRSLTQSEIPISAITGILGAIVFTIILLNKNRPSVYKRNINDIYQTINSNNHFSNYTKNICFANDKKENHQNNKKEIMTLNNIYYKYNKYSDYILNNISLSIFENDILLLYGSNGAGKTTLLKIMTGILKPSDGNVFIYNDTYKNQQNNFREPLKRSILKNLFFKNATNLVVSTGTITRKSQNSDFFEVPFTNINKLNLLEKSKYISYVKQDFSSIGNIFVKDYLILGMINELKFYQKPTIEQIEKVNMYAEELNIQKFLHKKFFELSGGEKQLVVICQSLLQNSKILILDEPTSSLDSDNQELIISTLIKLSKYYNKTIILSTHNKEHKNISGCMIKNLKNGMLV